MSISQLDHLNLTVSNLDQSIAWYGRVFGFELVERAVQDGVPWGVVKAGSAMLCIYEHPARTMLDRFELGDADQHGLNHLALRITDEAAWLATVEREHLTILYDGVVKWPHSQSWYLKDPTGYEIEVVLWNDDTIAFAPVEGE